jgi:hypothetical protein
MSIAVPSPHHISDYSSGNSTQNQIDPEKHIKKTPKSRFDKFQHSTPFAFKVRLTINFLMLLKQQHVRNPARIAVPSIFTPATRLFMNAPVKGALLRCHSALPATV